MQGLSELGTRSGGVWTRAEALATSSPGTVRAALRCGAWELLWPGVYADAGYPATPARDAWAAVLASSGTTSGAAVACGRTAARWWGLPLVDDHDPASGTAERGTDEVAVSGHRAVLRWGDRRLVRRRLRLEPDDVVQAPDGLLVTSIARTLVDCAVRLDEAAAVCAVDAALHRGLVGEPELRAAVLARRGTPGAAALARVVERADGRAESPLETLVRLLLVPVLPTLEPQVRVRDADDRVLARVDLGDRTRRLAVEADGVRAHAGPWMVARDRQRDAVLASAGWHTERITWYEVRRRPQETSRRVLRRAELLDREAGAVTG